MFGFQTVLDHVLLYFLNCTVSEQLSCDADLGLDSDYNLCLHHRCWVWWLVLSQDYRTDYTCRLWICLTHCGWPSRGLRGLAINRPGMSRSLYKLSRSWWVSKCFKWPASPLHTCACVVEGVGITFCKSKGEFTPWLRLKLALPCNGSDSLFMVNVICCQPFNGLFFSDIQCLLNYTQELTLWPMCGFIMHIFHGDYHNVIGLPHLFFCFSLPVWTGGMWWKSLITQDFWSPANKAFSWSSLLLGKFYTEPSLSRNYTNPGATVKAR